MILKLNLTKEETEELMAAIVMHWRAVENGKNNGTPIQKLYFFKRIGNCSSLSHKINKALQPTGVEVVE